VTRGRHRSGSPLRSCVRSSASALGLACLLAVGAAGCGSSAPRVTTSTAHASPLAPLRICLRQHGYAISPESAADVRTAPRRFEFFAVWNVVNPSRVALALTFSRDTGGAQQAAVWTRRENAALGRGAVAAPVTRIGRIDVLWTASPDLLDTKAVYGCVQRHA
jgi:hypothetical protein